MASFVMEYVRMIPSTTSLLSLYASFSTSLMLLRNVYNEVVPKKLEKYVVSKLSKYFSKNTLSPSYDTFIIDDSWDRLDHNKLMDAAGIYLSTKIGHQNKTVKVGKFNVQKKLVTGLVDGEKIVDNFEGIEITWKLVIPQKDDSISQKPYFQLRFEHECREKVLGDYLIHVLNTYTSMTKKEEVEPVLRLYSKPYNGWSGIDFQHPSTFETLAMDYDKKKYIMDDLDRFLARKDFYKRVGKAWKRGYLLYGPPGTGKSSLIAAMANYLKFDIYDLELSTVSSDADLKEAMLETENKSMIVIEDIDCNSNVHDRSNSNKDNDDHSSKTGKGYSKSSFTLSALLNCIDGLWTCCGEERVIVFTTNHIESLDPALLRPGRMDVHVHMSFCTTQGFRVLASNYLGIQDHQLFEEIDALIQSLEVTPASLAEELMKSDEADAALGEVVNFLRQKKMEKDMKEDKAEKEKQNKIDKTNKDKEKKIEEDVIEKEE